MFNMFASTNFHSKAIRLQKKLKGKKKDWAKDSCKCCSFCCWLKPCNLSKDDIDIMASHFKLTPQDLFKKYLVVDDAGAEPGFFTLTPIRNEWKLYAGGYLPSRATYDIDTPCTFLDEKTKKCTLHDLAKPSGGKNAECWTKENAKIFGFTKKELKKLIGWDGDTNDYDDDE